MLEIAQAAWRLQKTLDISEIEFLYYEKDKKDSELISGLGFVDFEIRPHLHVNGFPRVRIDVLEKFSKQHEGTVYALDDQSAVKVDGSQVTVVSEGEWKRFN